MATKNFDPNPKLSSLNSNYLPHPNQLHQKKSVLSQNASCKETSIDVHCEHPAQNHGSFFHAVSNMVGILIGSSQLSIPYALENGGWSSAFLFVGLGMICAYTSHLLGKCLQRNPTSRDYKDIGQITFGAKGRIAATIFVYAEIFMVSVSYTICLHDNLATLFLGTQLSSLSWTNLDTPQILTFFAILIAIPSLWLRDLSFISLLSVAGVFTSILTFVTVACIAISGAVKANHAIPILKINNIPAILGIYVYSYAGHFVHPNIYTGMKDPTKFTKVSIVSYSLATLIYTSLAFMGAKLFGPQVNSQITLSMPRELIVTKIALWATVITPMTKYALSFAPLAIQLEQHFSHSLKTRARIIIRGSVGSILLLVVLVLALSVPNFENVLSLTGSLLGVVICVILPCTFYIKIFWNEISRSELILNVLLLAVGVLLGASGTISSFRRLSDSLRRDQPS